MTPEEHQDLDETRRLATMARIGLAAGRSLSVDLVGTLMHATAYHAQEAHRDWCEELGKHLLQGDQRVLGQLDTLIDHLNEKLANPNFDEPAR